MKKKNETLSSEHLHCFCILLLLNLPYIRIHLCSMSKSDPCVSASNPAAAAEMPTSDRLYEQFLRAESQRRDTGGKEVISLHSSIRIVAFASLLSHRSLHTHTFAMICDLYQCCGLPCLAPCSSPSHTIIAMPITISFRFLCWRPKL